MRAFIMSCIAVSLVGGVVWQTEEPPLSEKRLSVHSLLREDIFAGWRSDDMVRFARGEKNIDLLLEMRPEAQADLLAWKGGAQLFRAVLAHEANKSDEYERLYKEVVTLFAEARKIGPKNPAVAAIVGGSYVVFADRLPQEHREAAWSESYANYKVLWGMQAPVVDKLPVHIRGELLAGLAQSSQRTGREEELSEYLDKILEVLPGTSYERVAKRWKKDPKVAANSNISCKTCHAPGRLSARVKALKK